MSIIETINRKLIAAPPEVARQVLDFLEALETQRRAKASATAGGWADFFGVLKDDKLTDGDAVGFQRRLRDEWDR